MKEDIDYELAYSNHTIIILDSGQISVSTALLNELIKSKVNIMVCDEKHNPVAEMNTFYGAYNTSKKIRRQIQWDENYQKLVWTKIIEQKIRNQAGILHMCGKEEALQLYEYAEELQFFDKSNREGHAAKIYFNRMFGRGFSREYECDINAALDYGYSILLSTFNKQIILNGYATQLGIKHINEYNQFNLSCDFMEPFRVIVDWYVYNNRSRCFDQQYKYELIDLLNKKYEYGTKNLYLTNIIEIYVRATIRAIEKKDIGELEMFAFP